MSGPLFEIYAQTLCEPGRIRTFDQVLKRHLRYHCATGPDEFPYSTDTGELFNPDPR